MTIAELYEYAKRTGRTDYDIELSDKNDEHFCYDATNTKWNDDCEFVVIK